MAATDDSAADNGEPMATTENIIGGPGPPNATANEVVLNGGDADNVDDTKDANASQVSFKLPCAVQHSRLLSLPPEIRNVIWKLCVSHPDDLGDKMNLQKKYGNFSSFSMVIHQRPGEPLPKLREAYECSLSKKTKRTIREHSARNLALMQTCQTAYNDAAPVLWGQRFAFQCILQLQAFLFSDGRLDLVRDIYVDKLDPPAGINYFPSICALLADKVKGLKRFDINMCRIHQKREGTHGGRSSAFRNNQEIREAAVNMGFDIYSCMHPWVTKVVHDQGIKALLRILDIPGKTGGKDDAQKDRTHGNFPQKGGDGVELTVLQQKIVDEAIGGEILRLVNLYTKKA